jgi:hypothetical protein
MPCLGQEKATQDAILLREKEAEEAQRREAEKEAQRQRREAEAENEAQRQHPEKRPQVRQQKEKARKQPQMTNGAEEEESVKKFSEEVAVIVARYHAPNAHDSTRVTSKDHPLLISVALHREGLFATLNSHQVCVCVSVSCARAKP